MVSEGKGSLRFRLIDTARRLFTTVGYDATTVEALIRAVGVSKGAFYHYFSSKVELLDAVAAEMAREAMADLEGVVAAPLPAVEKLNRFLALSQARKRGELPLLRELAQVLYREENIRLRHKVQARNLALALPPLAAIIAEGNAEGVFDVPDPEAAASALLQLLLQWGELRVTVMVDPTVARIAEVTRRHALLVDIFERILGAPRGSLERPDSTAMLAAARTGERGEG